MLAAIVFCGLFFCGLLVPLAFAPINFTGCALIGLTIWFYFLQKSTPRRAFWGSWFFGLGFFGLGVSWVYISINVYGHTPALLAFILTISFIMLLALLPAIQGWLCVRVCRYSSKASLLLMALPASWLLFEVLRSSLATGFPWLLLGYSQVDKPLQGLLSVIGVLGTSWVVALLAGALAFWMTCAKRFPPWQTIVIGCVVVMAAWFTHDKSWTHINTEHSLKVSLVQGNIPQDVKWSPSYVQTTLDRYFNLTLDNINHQQIIIWPEAAIPVLYEQAQIFINDLMQLSRQYNATIITGIPMTANNTSTPQINNDEYYYNTVISLGAQPNRYIKRHLVPFGEYLPFKKLLHGLINFFDLPMSDFIPGPRHQVALEINHTKIAPFICYEIAYANLVRESLALSNAGLLLVVTNDAWFGHSFAAAQHLQIAQARARETGRYLLFVANTGITAIIKPDGNIDKQLPMFRTGVLNGEVYAVTGHTPWMRWGHSWIIGLAVIVVILSHVTRLKHPR
ncbi:MAG: apolipoprotein N-acyltransferase [Gammaproteobacteria bacterium]